MEGKEKKSWCVLAGGGFFWGGLGIVEVDKIIADCLLTDCIISRYWLVNTLYAIDACVRDGWCREW